MVWVIVVVAVLLLALAAWVGTGKLGEMPEVVNDRPKGRIPEGGVDAEFLEGLKLPLASTGYDPAQVDTYLDELVAGTAVPTSEVRFRTVRRGYDMQAVDAVLDRVPGAHEAKRAVAEPEDAPADEAEALAEEASPSEVEAAEQTARDDREDAPEPARSRPEEA